MSDMTRRCRPGEIAGVPPSNVHLLALTGWNVPARGSHHGSVAARRNEAGTTASGSITVRLGAQEYENPMLQFSPPANRTLIGMVASAVADGVGSADAVGSADGEAEGVGVGTAHAARADARIAATAAWRVRITAQ